MIIDFEVLLQVGVASFVITTLLEKIKEEAKYHWDKLSDAKKQYIGYGSVVLAGGLMWLTGLDMLPGFTAVIPWAGRVLTCIAGGFGPKLVYDIWLDRPESPTREQ